MGSLIHSLKWDVIGKFAKRGSSFIFAIVLARLLSPSDFGKVGIASSFVGFLTLFAAWGYSPAIIQKDEVNAKELNTISFNVLGFSTVLCIITLIFSKKIAALLLTENEQFIFQYLSILIVINSISLIPEALLRRSMRFKIIANLRILSVILGGAIGVSTAVMGFGAFSLCLQLISQSVIFTILLFYYSRMSIPRFSQRSSLKEYKNFSLFMLLENLRNSGEQQIFNFVISNTFSVSTAGYYFRARSFIDISVSLVADSLASTFFPYYKRIKNQSNLVEVLTNYEIKVSLITVFLLGFIFSTSNELISLLLGESWMPTVFYLRAYCLIGFSSALIVLPSAILKSEGRADFLTAAGIFKSICAIFVIVFGSYYGEETFLVAFSLISPISIIGYYFYFKKIHDISLRYRLFFTIRFLIIFMAAYLPTTFITDGEVFHTFFKKTSIYISVFFVLTYGIESIVGNNLKNYFE